MANITNRDDSYVANSEYAKDSFTNVVAPIVEKYTDGWIQVKLKSNLVYWSKFTVVAKPTKTLKVENKKSYKYD